MIVLCIYNGTGVVCAALIKQLTVYKSDRPFAKHKISQPYLQ